LPAAHQSPRPLDTQQIRLRVIEKLREWEAENASAFLPLPELNDIQPPGEVLNSLTRPGSAEFLVDPNVDDMNEELQMVLGRDDLLDLGNNRIFLRSGDLVELL
jgi:hypothetical protein